jgi:hypothetical protein
MYKCTCYQGYSGVNCDIKISKCIAVTCVFGKCDEQTGKCQCSTGYEGEFCNIASFKGSFSRLR